MKYIKLFEEYLTSDAKGYEIGEFLYHTTTLNNKEDIERNGFIPKDGISIDGNYFVNRLYFATSLISAYDISVNFQAHGKGDDYIIYKISSKNISDYEIDPLFQHGIYIDYPISKMDILDVIDSDSLFDKFDCDDLDDLYQ